MRIITFLMAFLMFLSCNQKHFDSKEALLDYLQNEDNGYIQKKTVNGVDFSLMFKPTDLIVSQILQSKSVNNVDSLRNEYSKYLYFNLSMSINNQEILNIIPLTKNEYGSMANQLAFGMDEKVYLYTNNNDTIQMAEYIYPRMYGMGGSTSMLFVFPKNDWIKESKFLNFTIEDLKMQTGEIKFKINKNILVNQPIMIKNE
ncbi:hypothetical protein [Aequorivita sp. KMM 9714]|uniref:hypothetical protein n=1 Tax=Aequorivita sp. KMM 9714 TaxID=2707173 RepID=UPI0013EBDD19|nr:hypothetical protein [Aequorivita sp. KMM 9714]NGX85386.1 hypothetical protein [Aequorivita sp. KMM 9714]